MKNQRIDMRFPVSLLELVEKHQEERLLISRSAAILDLVRIGLATEIYKEQGAALFVKGIMMIGIHPDNLENNFKALSDGEISVDWDSMLKRANRQQQFDENGISKQYLEHIKKYEN